MELGITGWHAPVEIEWGTATFLETGTINGYFCRIFRDCRSVAQLCAEQAMEQRELIEERRLQHDCAFFGRPWGITGMHHAKANYGNRAHFKISTVHLYRSDLFQTIRWHINL